MTMVDTKGSGTIEMKWKAKVSMFGKLDKYMKDTGKVAKPTAWVEGSFLMEMSTLASTRMTRSMVKVSSFTPITIPFNSL